MTQTRGFHHVAYRCKDAKETVEFYHDLLGMEFTVAFAEDHVPSTGEYDPYMHVFLDAGGGNVLAFFDVGGAHLDVAQIVNDAIYAFFHPSQARLDLLKHGNDEVGDFAHAFQHTCSRDVPQVNWSEQ